MPATTTTQSLPLFDAAEARKARDAGVSTVQRSADKFWFGTAQIAVREIASRSEKFTTDQVWDRIKQWPRPHDPRAMGAVMTWARKAEIVEPTAEFVQSQMVSNHGRPIRVWRSLLFCD